MGWTISQTLYAKLHCSPAPAEGCTDLDCSDGKPSPPSRSTPTPDLYFAPDKTTEHSTPSLSGMTFELLTADRGADLLTLYLAASHASKSQHAEARSGSTASDPDSGAKCGGSFASVDRASSSLRTRQVSLFADWIEYCAILPKWGSMRNGELWERRASARVIIANECGFLPTPTASDAKDRGNLSNPSIQRRIAIGKQVMLSMCASASSGKLNPEWVELLMGWPAGSTAFAPLETDKFRFAWLTPSKFLLEGLVSRYESVR